MPAIYVGIDPGKTGAVAQIDELGRGTVVDIPTITFATGGKTKSGNPKKKTDYDGPAVAEVFRPYAEMRKAGTHEIVVALEWTMARAKDTGITGFAMGHGRGIIEGVLWALGLPYVLVTPTEWRPKMVGRGADKEKARWLAQQLFPDAELRRKKDHNRAEALLIAEYYRRKLAGTDMPKTRTVKKRKRVRKEQ